MIKGDIVYTIFIWRFLMKKIFMILLILVVVGSSAFAFDFFSFPSPIQKGNLLISPTFGIGTYWYSGATLAFTASFDYALPINFGLTVGGEDGIAIITYAYSHNKPIAIPIMAKVAWHPNFEVQGLDVFTYLKMGVAIGLLTNKLSDDYTGRSGFAYGYGVGVRYFFTPAFGIFGEVGYDRYTVGVRYKPSSYWNDTWWMATFFHAGITFKV